VGVDSEINRTLVLIFLSLSPSASQFFRTRLRGAGGRVLVLAGFLLVKMSQPYYYEYPYAPRGFYTKKFGQAYYYEYSWVMTVKQTEAQRGLLLVKMSQPYYFEYSWVLQ
jgi:hypothetical protein